MRLTKEELIELVEGASERVQNYQLVFFDITEENKVLRAKIQDLEEKIRILEEEK